MSGVCGVCVVCVVFVVYVMCVVCVFVVALAQQPIPELQTKLRRGNGETTGHTNKNEPIMLANPISSNRTEAQ